MFPGADALFIRTRKHGWRAERAMAILGKHRKVRRSMQIGRFFFFPTQYTPNLHTLPAA